MRSAIIGAVFSRDQERMEAYLDVSTRITHSDPKALTAARAVAKVAAWIVERDIDERPSRQQLLAILRSSACHDPEWEKLIDSLSGALASDLTVEAFAERLDLAKGISGFAYHTVLMALYAWYRYLGDFERGLSAVINCGGDTDTAGAIVGALSGATSGEAGIPRDWISGVIDWPRGIRLLEKLADALSSGRPEEPISYFWPAVALRNLLFLMVVLAHGFRRLAPPY